MGTALDAFGLGFQHCISEEFGIEYPEVRAEREDIPNFQLSHPMKALFVLDPQPEHYH